MLKDREARDRVIDQLKAKIRQERELLQERVDDSDTPETDARPYRARRLSEVFRDMGF